MFQLLSHDMSKFLPWEWMPYVNLFYSDNNKEKSDRAWLYHLHKNKHHWQYWILHNDDGTTVTLKMPEKYIREMIADWASAGRVINGYWDIESWYSKNRSNMTFHQDVKNRVDFLVLKISYELGGYRSDNE